MVPGHSEHMNNGGRDGRRLVSAPIVSGWRRTMEGAEYGVYTRTMSTREMNPRRRAGQGTPWDVARPVGNVPGRGRDKSVNNAAVR